MEKINPVKEKIQAIKALRTFCAETFDATPNLKESKEFIDHVIDCGDQQKTEAIYNFLSQGLSITYEEVRQLVIKHTRN